MVRTARYLQEKLKRKDQTIILTGSLIPLLGLTPSDGPFNIGYSIAKVQEFPPGVYICMNGKIFTSEEVEKNITAGRFEEVA